MRNSTNHVLISLKKGSNGQWSGLHEKASLTKAEFFDKINLPVIFVYDIILLLSNKYMSTHDSLENSKETIARKELIKKALIAWSEIFSHQEETSDERIEDLEISMYAVGDRYPTHSPTDYNENETYLSGVRLGYHQIKQGMWLYANDYKGDPAPLLIQLAEELEKKGVKIVYIQRQFSYDPPNPEITDIAIKKFNDSKKQN